MTMKLHHTFGAEDVARLREQLDEWRFRLLYEGAPTDETSADAYSRLVEMAQIDMFAACAIPAELINGQKEAAMEQSKRVVPMVGDVWLWHRQQRTIHRIESDGGVLMEDGGYFRPGRWEESVTRGDITFIRRRNAPDPRIAELEAELVAHDRVGRGGAYQPSLEPHAFERFQRHREQNDRYMAAQLAFAEVERELATLRGTARTAETIPAPASEQTIEERFPIGSRWRYTPTGAEITVTGHKASHGYIIDEHGDQWGTGGAGMPHAGKYERIDTPIVRVPGRNPPTLEGWAKALGVNIAPACDFTGPTIPPHALELTDHGTCRTCASSASDRRRARRAKFDAGVRTSLVTVEIDASKPFINGRGEKKDPHLHPEHHTSVHVASFGGKAGPQMPTAAMATEALWTMLERGAR